MKILVTGAGGVIGAGALPELLKQGHSLRLLSRAAEKSAREYPGPVEAFPGDVTAPETLKGAADGCEAIVHIAGIVEERPPETTFEKVNVAGTQHILREASRARVRRFIYISSLGADSGSSEYHKSKLRAEEFVRDSELDWLILRPGNVYGPGDDVLSLLLKIVRTLPIVPLVGAGDQPFQPIWFEDLGRVIARALDRKDLSRETLEVAGTEIVTAREVIGEFSRITGRSPKTVALPEWLAQAGTELADSLPTGWIERLGLKRPLNASKLQMLLDENIIRSPERNALTSIFALEPTPLSRGLVLLADSLPELLPEDGVGALERKRFWTDIRGSRYSAPELLRFFREHISEIMPIEFEAEPNVPNRAHPGETLTGAIPGRGNFQVRVEEASDTSVTLATLEGHPLAGTVTFSAEEIDGAMRFLIEVQARPSNIFDWLALRLGGHAMQNQNWKEVVARVADLSGGTMVGGIQHESEALGDEEAKTVERDAERLVQRRKREETLDALANN